MRAQSESMFANKFRLGGTRKTTREGIADEIKKRAYEIFLSKGATHGHDFEDWIEAEREIINSSKKRHSR